MTITTTEVGVTTGIMTTIEGGITIIIMTEGMGTIRRQQLSFGPHTPMIRIVGDIEDALEAGKTRAAVPATGGEMQPDRVTRTSASGARQTRTSGGEEHA